MENPLELPTPPPEQSEPVIPHSGDLSGRTLGEFQLIRRIGQGGMGQVYLARQLSLKRQVAIKILRTDLASNVSALKRFKAEAEAVARITHANIVQVYAISECDGLHYMALEYVEGRNLRDYIGRKGPPDLHIAILIMRQVAAALQRAGELGFIHRDIKPDNILLTRKVEAKVADFGLSRCFATDEPMNITQSGVTMGTPLYMSPEQVQGHTLDPRSDIYSFGVTCYHMFAGEPPFKGQTPFEVAIQHVQNEPAPLLDVRPDLPPEICTIVHKMMAKKPEDRYQTPREILRDLTRMREGLATTNQQLAITHNGTSGVSALTAVSGMSGTQPVLIARARWPRWALAFFLLLCAGTVGAAYHWKTVPQPEVRPPDPEAFSREDLADPAKTLEKDLLKRLNDSSGKSDIEATNALLDLTMLYIRDRRFDREKPFDTAYELYEVEKLRKHPALIDPLKKGQNTQYFTMLSVLGKGIVLAHEDRATDSNDAFKKVLVMLPTLPPPKDKKSRLAVDNFLWKFERWKRAVADSLERNAKNLNVSKLDEPLNRYRMYSSKLP